MERLIELAIRQPSWHILIVPSPSDPTIFPRLVSPSHGTSTCTVRYSDNSVANIPYIRYLWESKNGRLRKGYRVEVRSAAVKNPQLVDLMIVATLRKSAVARVQLRNGRESCLPRRPPITEIPPREAKSSQEAKRNDLVIALEKLITAVPPTTCAKEVSFPGAFEDCTSGEEQIILWDFIRSSPAVYAETGGTRQLIFSSQHGYGSLPNLIVSCRTQRGLKGLISLVNDLKSQG